MREINKLLQGQDACMGLSHLLFVSEISLVRCAHCSISGTSQTCANIPYARHAHEVISIWEIPDAFFSAMRQETREQIKLAKKIIVEL